MGDSSAFTLDARYTQTEGTILLSGVQALVRLPLDQHRADQRRGLNTAGLISGYRGSPLAGLDLLIERNAALLREHQIKFIPGINEDMGATMLYGSQIANLFPLPKYDGVIGMWYGKAPGVDRSGDIFKHANFAGVGPHGGVLVVAGDDALAKSSTLPSHSEPALYDALMPVLAPGNVQEILDFGRLGFELSRFAGLWVGFKLATSIADEFATAVVGVDRPLVVRPEFTVNGQPWRPTQTHTLGAPTALRLEQEIYEGRLAAAVAFAAANHLNRMTVAAPDARLGIVAAGSVYYELRQALADLGIADATLERYGIRLLQIGMPFPLDQAIVRTFASGLEEIIVVEEKRPFLELFIRDALYDLAERPRVLGKRDAQGALFVPAHGELDADRIVTLLAGHLARRVPAELLEPRLAALRGQRDVPVLSLTSGPSLSRTPYFCSGCPHNRSTIVPDGSIAGGGIGCHGLVFGMERNTIGLGHMGGEGAQWAGVAPFTETTHIFQNIGDGTLFHSGSLAVRQVIASGANITYKILYNNAVGMTGGQEVDGAMSAPALTRALEAEGVRRIIVTSEDPAQYGANVRWAPGVEVWHRDRLDEAQRILREEPGVTVLLHDQMCAAERRRLRKRGKLPDPATRVFINQAVCEGCGDCGAKSNCLSVIPVETEYGRKTQIHQSSCNKDYSCLLGDCPAFVTVETRSQKSGVSQQSTANSRQSAVGSRQSAGDTETPRRRDTGVVGGPSSVVGGPSSVDGELPAPHAAVTSPHAASWNIYMTGIGGTGVVTVNQVLATAALLDGKQINSLDQTGLSQKGGPVVSHLKIGDAPIDGSNRLAAGEADCYLAFDILTAAAPQHLLRADPSRTAAVGSTSQVATGAMVRSPATHFPALAGLLDRINQRTRAEQNLFFDAIAVAEAQFGDYLAANMIVVGAAYQSGLIPLTVANIERAITLNGVAVRMNTEAFRLGRRIALDPTLASAANMSEVASDRSPEHATAEPPAVTSVPAVAQALIDGLGAQGELRRLLEIRVPELIAYQNLAYARHYLAFVGQVRAAEQRVLPGATQLSESVARYLFKLMAYKDEYEVARLHLTSGLKQSLAQQFGNDATLHYHLHPPFLRALGWQKKLRFGRWFDTGYRALMAARGLRGTPFDPFGYAHMRRVERDLISEYRGLIAQALAGLTPETHERAVALARLPDMIRGYESIKLENIARYHAAVQALGFAAPTVPTAAAPAAQG